MSINFNQLRLVKCTKKTSHVVSPNWNSSHVLLYCYINFQAKYYIKNTHMYTLLVILKQNKKLKFRQTPNQQKSRLMYGFTFRHTCNFGIQDRKSRGVENLLASLDRCHCPRALYHYSKLIQFPCCCRRFCYFVEICQSRNVR